MALGSKHTDPELRAAANALLAAAGHKVEGAELKAENTEETRPEMNPVQKRSASPAPKAIRAVFWLAALWVAYQIVPFCQGKIGFMWIDAMRTTSVSDVSGASPGLYTMMSGLASFMDWYLRVIGSVVWLSMAMVVLVVGQRYARIAEIGYAAYQKEVNAQEMETERLVRREAVRQRRKDLVEEKHAEDSSKIGVGTLLVGMALGAWFW